MARSPKLLKCSLDIGNTISPTSWAATITGIVAQQHQAYVNPRTGGVYYNGLDVNNDDFITTTSSGKCLKITNITAQTDVSFNCILVDEGEINRSIDALGDGRILEGNGYIFELIDGVPALFPLPSGLEAGFNFTFASQLMSRFISNGGGIGSVPEDVLTESDIGTLVPNLTTGKVPLAQLPVGTNPVTQVAPGGDYLLSIARGSTNGVAPLIDGKVPVANIPTVTDVFETVTSYSDLANIVNKSTDVYYIVETENAVYKWTGSAFIKITGEATQTSYSYVSVTDSSITYTASDKDVISVIGNNVTIELPLSPENGYEIIILNTGTGTVIDPNGATIRNSVEVYNLADTIYSTYLVYVNGWQFSESNRLVNVYTEQPGADQFGPADYWPAGTKQSMQDLSIYNKEAYLETWESTRTQMVTILNYQAPYGNTIIRGTTTTTEGWVAKDVENGVTGNMVTVTGATGNAVNLNGTWEITAIISETTFEFVITTPITYTLAITTGIGNTVRIIKEHLAEQATIFEPNSDDFRSIWFPKSGLALERRVTFDQNLMPSVTYSNNLVLTVCKLLSLDWKVYETFNSLVSSDYNFSAIIERQDLLNTISSNGDFIREFINSRSDLHYENPVMTSNTTPSGNSVGGSTKLGGTDYFHAFDNSLDSAWSSNTGEVTDEYLQLAMPSTVLLFPYAFTIYTKSAGFSPRTVQLQYQDSFNAWIIVGEYILSNDTIEDTFYVFKAGVAAKAWRFVFVDGYSVERMIVNNIKLRGWNIYGL